VSDYGYIVHCPRCGQEWPGREPLNPALRQWHVCEMELGFWPVPMPTFKDEDRVLYSQTRPLETTSPGEVLEAERD